MRAQSGSRRRLRAAVVAALATLALVLSAATLDGTGASFSATTANTGNDLATRQLLAPSALTASQSCSTVPAIVRRSSSTAQGTAAVTVPMPTGTVVGDYLLAQIAYHDDDRTLTAPSGWQWVGQTGNTTIASNVFWKVATSTEASSGATATFRHPDSASPEYFVGAVTAFRNARAVAPLSFRGAAGSSSTVTTPSVPSIPDADVTVVHLFTKTQGPLDPASGITNYYDRATGTGSGEHVGIRGGGEVFAGPGSTSSRSATGDSSSRYVAQAVVLRHAVATPTANLSWTASASSWAGGYELTRRVGTTLQETQQVTGVSTTSASSGPLVNGTSYTFGLTTARNTWRSASVTRTFTPSCP